VFAPARSRGCGQSLQGHPQDIHWQGEWQFAARLRVQHEFMFRQLGLGRSGELQNSLSTGVSTMTLGALLSAVIEISKCTSQSAALTLASCRNALATWTIWELPPRHRDITLKVNHICGACSESRREVERALIESVGPRREPALHVHGETLVKNHCRIARANLHFALRP